MEGKTKSNRCSPESIRDKTVIKSGLTYIYKDDADTVVVPLPGGLSSPRHLLHRGVDAAPKPNLECVCKYS